MTEADRLKGNGRGSGYERDADDWYVEPESAVRALLAAERFFGMIWDPACGRATIPRVAEAWGYPVLGSDRVDRGYGMVGDFLAGHVPSTWDCANIVCNPPYGAAEQFADRAIALAEHKVAFLVRLAWLEGDGRYSRLFGVHPPSRILVFRNRISCPPGAVQVEAKGGAVAYCWVIWNRDHRGPTQLDWVKA